MCLLDLSEFLKCHPPSKSLRKHTVVTDLRQQTINLCQGHPYMHVRRFGFWKGSDLRIRKQAICSLFSSIALWRRVCEQPLGPDPQHVASQPCLTWKEKPNDTVKVFSNRLLLQSLQCFWNLRCLLYSCDNHWSSGSCFKVFQTNTSLVYCVILN